MFSAQLIEFRAGRKFAAAQLGQVRLDVAEPDARRSSIVIGVVHTISGRLDRDHRRPQPRVRPQPPPQRQIQRIVRVFIHATHPTEQPCAHVPPPRQRP